MENNLSNVVSMTGGELVVIDGRLIPAGNPISSTMLLDTLKRFLSRDDYEDLLLSIMDLEYYNQADDDMKQFVNAYYDLCVQGL